MADKVAIASRFVHAKHDDWGFRQGPALGFVIHMAEGFNVWRYLAYGNVARNVSVHFTIEQDGEIVQMLGLNRISGSINPNTIRRDDDQNGHFGYSHNRAVMMGWWSNPNHATITVEVAGYQKDGPNEKQLDSIQRLFAFLKGKYPLIKPLGHRDFQNVKPCPGQKMWYKAYPLIGGHGKEFEGITPSDSGNAGVNEMIKGDFQRTSERYVDLPEGVKVYDAPNGNVIRKTTHAKAYDYFGYGGGGWWAIGIWNDGSPVIAWIKKGDYDRGTWPETPAPTTPDQEALIKRIEELQSALQEIAETSKTALVD